MSDAPGFKFSAKVSRLDLAERLGRNPLTGDSVLSSVYHTSVEKLDRELIIGGAAQRIVFEKTNTREGFRTYVSKYGREVANSYENGWRFRCSANKEGDEIVLYVYKIRATIADKERRAEKRGRKSL